MEVSLDTYQITLEEVLTWLLSAEDTLHMQDDVSDDVEEVKDQFHTHEVEETHINHSQTLLVSSLASSISLSFSGKRIPI